MGRFLDNLPSHADQTVAGRHNNGTPMVSFVGAGPGAADLLTVKAIRVLAQADVVLYDSLGCAEALDFCPQAKLIPVGKRAGGQSTEQTFINQALVVQAMAGQHVVRLKGGDPTVFGRLDEEITAVVAAGVNYQIVPGITAASAAAASAGVTLTQRGLARGVTLVTPATGRDEKANSEWAQAAAAGTTVAVYMAGKQIAKTARQLRRAGFAADTPVLIGIGVSTATERFINSHIGALTSGQALEPGSDGPCILLVGQAVRMRKTTLTKGTETTQTVIAA